MSFSKIFFYQVGMRYKKELEFVCVLILIASLCTYYLFFKRLYCAFICEGDDPETVKMRLRRWAQVVACSVRQTNV